MKNEIDIETIGACWKALESCPHAGGTVDVMCRVCLGSGGVFAYDSDRGEWLSIDCPRCADRVGTGRGVPEACPCLEPYNKQTITRVVELGRKPSRGKAEGPQPLAAAMKWQYDRDDPGVPLESGPAAEQLTRLRAWAEDHREVTIPHPKAALLLHLLDRDMIRFQTEPETGKLVVKAIGAKEEFCRFITVLNRRYAHDESTVLELLNFAYGIDTWEFDPLQLQAYARGKETLEIQTSAFEVHSQDGLLCGKREVIEDILLSVLEP